MKKTYINPTLEVVVLKYNNSLLAGSGTKTGDTLGNEFNKDDVTYGRDFDFDDEEY